LHDELQASLKWRLMQFFPKKQWRRAREGGRDVWIERRQFDLAGWRKIPPRALIHETAYARGAAYIVNLPADATRITTLPPVGAQSATVEPLKASA
jgi:hypothetical protein